MIKLLCLLGVIVFVVAAGAVELIRRKQVSIAQSWISTYITGPYSWIEDLGFAGLAVSLFLLPHVLNLSLVQTAAATVAGVAVILVVVTRKYFPTLFPSLLPSAVTRMHVTSAIVAFVCAIIAAWAHRASIGSHIILVLTAIVCLAAVSDEADNGKQIAEKLGALGISLSIIEQFVR